jgi:CMP-N-acetylneuraminic acid synthetase
MKYLIIITARGGSKGIPKKNIKLLNEKTFNTIQHRYASQILG